MGPSVLESSLKSLIVENAEFNKICESDIKSESNLANDYGYDSIQFIKLILNIEERFSISIEDHEIDFDSLVVFHKLVSLIYEKLLESVSLRD